MCTYLLESEIEQCPSGYVRNSVLQSFFFQDSFSFRAEICTTKCLITLLVLGGCLGGKWHGNFLLHFGDQISSLQRGQCLKAAEPAEESGNGDAHTRVAPCPFHRLCHANRGVCRRGLHP